MTAASPDLEAVKAVEGQAKAVERQWKAKERQ